MTYKNRKAEYHEVNLKNYKGVKTVTNHNMCRCIVNSEIFLVDCRGLKRNGQI